MANGIGMEVDTELLSKFGSIGSKWSGADGNTLAKIGAQLGRELARTHISKLSAADSDGTSSSDSKGLGRTLALAGLGGLVGGGVGAGGGAYLGHRLAKSEGHTSAGAGPTVAGAGLGATLATGAGLMGGVRAYLQGKPPTLARIAPLLGAAGAVGGAYLGHRLGSPNGRQNAAGDVQKQAAVANGDEHREPGGGPTAALAGTGALIGGPLGALGGSYLGQRLARGAGMPRNAGQAVAGAGLGSVLAPVAGSLGLSYLTRRDPSEFIPLVPLLSAAGAAGGAYIGHRRALRKARKDA